MSITAEQRTELERRGFPVTEDGMVRVCGYLVDPRSREWRAYLTEMALAAAILGIHPPGYRLVKEEVLQKAIRELTDDGSSEETAMACIAEGIATVHEAERLRKERRYSDAREMMDRADSHFDEGTARLDAVKSILADAALSRLQQKPEGGGESQ